MQRGFSLIEAAIVLLIAGLALSGFTQILQSSIASRQTTIQAEATETMKMTAILAASNAKTYSGTCYAGSCAAIGPCSGATPCYTTTGTYPIPASITPTKDFWGNNMTYTVVTSSVNSATVPGTVIFKIVSNGPDAIAGNADDLTYNVTTEEFFTRIARTGL